MVNDRKNIAAFIQQDLPDIEHILIYNNRSPSMAFLTEKNIISLFDGAEDLNRETQFQKNENWKANLINLQEQPDWLVKKLPKNAVLMVKKNHLHLEIIKEAGKGFGNSKEMDGWVLFF